MTKWEKYSKEKGIKKQANKPKMVWDDIVKEWVPRFGYKKAKAEAEKNWLMEYKASYNIWTLPSVTASLHAL